MRPGFESRTGSVLLFCLVHTLRAVWVSGCTAPVMSVMFRLAQLVERKTLNLVVVGSSPTVGVCLCFFILVKQKKIYIYIFQIKGKSSPTGN